MPGCGGVVLLAFLLSWLEVSLLVKVAGDFGLMTTLVFCLMTAGIGGMLVREQGIKTLMELQSKLGQGEDPAAELLGGVMLVICGVLLFVPGFVTDAIGFLLLYPPLRMRAAKILVGSLKQRVRFAGNFGGSFAESENQYDACEGVYTTTDYVRRDPSEVQRGSANQKDDEADHLDHVERESDINREL